MRLLRDIGVFLNYLCVSLTMNYDIITFAGDEILDWNEISLVDCTDEEVQDIIAMDDSCDLHLVISRDR